MDHMNQLFSKGEFIFHQGDEGDYAYIIEEGSIEIFLEEGGDEIPVARLGVGEIFGEMVTLHAHGSNSDGGSLRSASARVMKDCCLSIVSRSQLHSSFEKAGPILKLLVNTFLQRMGAGLQKKSIEENPHEKLKMASLETNLSTPPSSWQGQNHETLHHEALGYEYGFSNKGIMAKMNFEQDIKEAFENKEFFIQYQPIVHMASRQLAGFEALIRWKSPTKGLVRPDLFMAVAEEGSLMAPIGRWVLQQAIKDLKEITRTLECKPFMAINVSGRQIADSSFFKTLENELDKTGCDPAQIKLELTERVFVEGRVAKNWIHHCQEMGVTVALDDFGTGYSSLGSLRELKVDNFKIDRSFVSHLMTDKVSTVIVQGLMSIAQGLGIAVVAEGIETRKQEQGLNEMGCSYGQGYIYSKSLSLDQVIELCQQKQIDTKSPSPQRIIEFGPLSPSFV